MKSLAPFFSFRKAISQGERNLWFQNYCSACVIAGSWRKCPVDTYIKNLLSSSRDLFLQLVSKIILFLYVNLCIKDNIFLLTYLESIFLFNLKIYILAWIIFYMRSLLFQVQKVLQIKLNKNAVKYIANIKNDIWIIYFFIFITLMERDNTYCYKTFIFCLKTDIAKSVLKFNWLISSRDNVISYVYNFFLSKWMQALQYKWKIRVNRQEDYVEKLHFVRTGNSSFLRGEICLTVTSF